MASAMNADRTGHRKLQQSSVIRAEEVVARKHLPTLYDGKKAVCNLALDEHDNLKQFQKNCSTTKLSYDDDQLLDIRVKKRMTRAKLVRRKTVAIYKKQLEALRQRMTPQLFDRAIIVKLMLRNEENELHYRNMSCDYVPYIAFKYPQSCSTDRTAQNSPSPTDCPDLFIPDFTKAKAYGKNDEWNGNEEFMLTLTDESGKRTFAYCVRHLIRKSAATTSEANCSKEVSLPEVFAIISQIYAQQFYTMVARECVAHLPHGLQELKHFCDAIYNCEIPENGATLQIVDCSEQGIEKLVTISRQETMFGRLNCSRVVKRIGAGITVAIIGALLAEQRVLITGDSVQSVCHAVQSLASLLQPFSWPYTFIPVLPDSLLEIANSPTPYLIGVLRSNLYKLKSLVVTGCDDGSVDLIQDDVVIIDLDGGIFVPRIRTPFIAAESADYKEKSALELCDKFVIPKKLSLNLIVQLKEALLETNESSADSMIQKTALSWYASLIGPYKSYPFHAALAAESYGDDEPLRKCKAQLISSHTSKSIRRFIEWFIETGIFREWIRHKVNKCSGNMDYERANYDAANQMFDELVLAPNPRPQHKRFSSIFAKAQNAIFRTNLLKKL